MSADSLNDRRKALENQFFADRDSQLIQQIRNDLAKKAARDSLIAASGIDDVDVIDTLIAIGITGETLAAMALIPLVAVAWADGKLSDSERDAILRAANDNGSADAGGTHALLESWLVNKPSNELLDVWCAYIKAINKTLTPQARSALKQRLVGNAREVAGAAGGFLGMGNKVSKTEMAVLDILDGCFHD